MKSPPSSSASPLLPIAPSSSSSSSHSSSSLHRRRSSLPVPEEFFHHSIIRVTREGGDHPVWIGLSNEAIPQDLDGRRPESWRWLAGLATSWWGPTESEQVVRGGGIDIDYCAFPTCPGNPRGIVSAPALRFCTLLPPPSSLPHYLLLIVSGERLSFCLPVCLVFFLSPSLSLFLSFFPLSTYLCSFPCFAYRSKKSRNRCIYKLFSRIDLSHVSVTILIPTSVDCSHRLLAEISISLFRKQSATRPTISTRRYR